MITIFLLILVVVYFFINEKINKKKSEKEIGIFLIWFAKNHFYLYNTENGMYYFKSESYDNKEYNLIELIRLYKKEISE